MYGSRAGGIRRVVGLFSVIVFGSACRGDKTSLGGGDAGESPDAGPASSEFGGEAGGPDVDVSDGGAEDSSPGQAGDHLCGRGRDRCDQRAPAIPSASQDASAEDASDAGTACPPWWLSTPLVDPSLVPEEGGVAIFHAFASGTQDYACVGVEGDAGTTFSWKFIGPEATLTDCNAAVVGQHFASDGGPAAPEWQTIDGTYVIGNAATHAVGDAGSVVKFDGGASSVPWLLLQAIETGGSGTLSVARYIQRVQTDGGVAPSTPCDATALVQKIPYTADYYFYGP